MFLGERKKKKKERKKRGRRVCRWNVIDDSVTDRRSTRRTGQRGVSVRDAECRRQRIIHPSVQRCAAHVVARASRFVRCTRLAKYNLSCCVVNSFNVVARDLIFESNHWGEPVAWTDLKRFTNERCYERIYKFLSAWKN